MDIKTKAKKLIKNDPFEDENEDQIRKRIRMLVSKFGARSFNKKSKHQNEEREKWDLTEDYEKLAEIHK